VGSDTSAQARVSTTVLTPDSNRLWGPKLRSSPLFHPYLVLVAATVFCLAPFSGRAFHVDDTLFIRAAQQIAKHPLDPYGFEINWDGSLTSMADVTQNPPVSSYYIALLGSAFGWSERALHWGFILIAIALVLGTYRLAEHFTDDPLFAALVTLLCPGVLVSASSLMCDTMMLALWLWAAIFWIEGLERRKMILLAGSSLLIAVCALTKYFGISLIPLLLVYTIMRRRIVSGLWLLVPVAVLIWYQQWTAGFYGHGLLFGAADFAASQRSATQGSQLAPGIVGLSFAGGCGIFGLFFAPFVWSRKDIIITAIVSGVASLAVVSGFLNLGLRIGGGEAERSHLLTGIQLALYVGAGISLIALAVDTVLKQRLPDSVFLSLWLLGTFLFASYVNYTVNARSVYPLIPAAAILLTRRLGKTGIFSKKAPLSIVLLLLFSGLFSLWVVAGDSALGNSARDAASRVMERAKGATTVWFEGHWGFQYYMESKGARALDFSSPELQPGDVVVIPSNNVQIQGLQPQFIASQESFAMPMNDWVTTISWQLGAGFYSSYWGPNPYSIGSVPSETYQILHIGGQQKSEVKSGLSPSGRQ
jgi:hypothetical protein